MMSPACRNGGGGIVRPSAFAALLFMTSSYFLGPLAGPVARLGALKKLCRRRGAALGLVVELHRVRHEPATPPTAAHPTRESEVGLAARSTMFCGAVDRRPTAPNSDHRAFLLRALRVRCAAKTVGVRCSAWSAPPRRMQHLLALELSREKSFSAGNGCLEPPALCIIDTTGRRYGRRTDRALHEQVRRRVKTRVPGRMKLPPLVHLVASGR